MFVWFAANWGSIAVALVLCAVVALIVRSMIRDRRQGKSSCGGNCGSCAGCSGCAGRCSGCR